MQSIDLTRRLRLEMLVKKFGSYVKLNEALGRSKTDSKLNAIANEISRTDRPGKIFKMGDQMARDIEVRLSLPTGWMDTPPSYIELNDEGDQKAKLWAVMEKLPADQWATAIRLLDALVEHPKQERNGTGDK